VTGGGGQAKEVYDACNACLGAYVSATFARCYY
jgi:hypothetical protein